MAIGPSPGDGYSWQRGPWTLGLQVLPDAGGFGEALVLLHLTPGGWEVGPTVMMDVPGAWQDIINIREPDLTTEDIHDGLEGAYYVKDLMPKINKLIEQFYPINPLAGTLIKNTDRYSRDGFNAMIAQYTGNTEDGKLMQVPGRISRMISAVKSLFAA